MVRNKTEVVGTLLKEARKRGSKEFPICELNGSGQRVRIFSLASVPPLRIL